MSYPDLGCFAECLTCELCENPPPGLGGDGFDVDLFPDDLLPEDPAWDDFDPPPDSGEGGNWWDDYNLPEGPGVGGVDITPTWDPWGIEVGGTF
ncbi:MAG: hypothetical protein JWP95_1346 [Actinotalea sp.]|nr:hypothetical protein [Actinotalea sp.]